jgi:Uma2 family endonuclease
MPVIPEARPYTVAEVLAFPADGNRYEVVDGELLVNPSPRLRHQWMVTHLMVALGDYLESFGQLHRLFAAPADITWGLHPDEAEDLVQPDVFVVGDRAYGEWVDVEKLRLAVEVVSPSSTRADRVVKRRTYQRHGVDTYWVVDADAELVEVWHPEDDRPAIVTDVLTWRWDDQSPELKISLAELFAAPKAPE